MLNILIVGMMDVKGGIEQLVKMCIRDSCFTGGGFIAPMALASVPKDKQPGACVGCRSCEAVCPQQIRISEAMADFSEKLNG